MVSLLRIVSVRLVLFLILIGVAILFFQFSNLKLVSSEEFNDSFSSFISIKGEDEYVVASLRSGETVRRQMFNKTIFDLPIGDTEASLSVIANYKYYIRLGDVVHRLADGKLYIDVPDLKLSMPVAFDITSVSESSKKTGFGPREEFLIKQLRVDMARQLRVKGELQKRSVYEQAAKSLADNFNKYLVENGFSGAYEEIVVSFNGVDNVIRRLYEPMDDDCGYLPCKVNFSVGDYHIFSVRKYN